MAKVCAITKRGSIMGGGYSNRTVQPSSTQREKCDDTRIFRKRGFMFLNSKSTSQSPFPPAQSRPSTKTAHTPLSRKRESSNTKIPANAGIFVYFNGREARE
jgi:hypothetical protein